MTPEEYWIKYQPKPVTPALYDKMTFGFVIEQMHTKTVNDIPNVVYKVNYYIWGNYQGEQGRVAQELTFSQEFLNEQASFIPYGQLTQETVIAWIEDNAPYIHIQYTIANQLDVSSDDTPPLPWAQKGI